MNAHCTTLTREYRTLFTITGSALYRMRFSSSNIIRLPLVSFLMFLFLHSLECVIVYFIFSFVYAVCLLSCPSPQVAYVAASLCHSWALRARLRFKLVDVLLFALSAILYVANPLVHHMNSGLFRDQTQTHRVVNAFL